ncbi:MAG: DUF2971 domain-containing protein, partial [Proteobacteria bacterium]|nr:DUF2971 domain-containing protein [Pseudomonadota bacterium]
MEEQQLLYRFRPTDKLLGEKYQELERQQIYFATPEELNDPMEGFREYFWRGDEIIWKNFFRHYLLCLEHVSSLFVIGGEEHFVLCENDINVFKSINDFPTDMYRQLYLDLCLMFFDQAIVKDIIKLLSKN